MNDAISRSELIKILKEWPERLSILLNPTCEEYAERQGTLQSFAAIVEEVEGLPALDVEPVIHAKWIEDGYYEKPSVCSHCGEEAFSTSTFRELSDYDLDENLISLGYEEDKEYVLTKWCPNCGAKMDGGKKNAVD